MTIINERQVETVSRILLLVYDYICENEKKRLSIIDIESIIKNFQIIESLLSEKNEINIDNKNNTNSSSSNNNLNNSNNNFKNINLEINIFIIYFLQLKNKDFALIFFDTLKGIMSNEKKNIFKNIINNNITNINYTNIKDIFNSDKKYNELLKNDREIRCIIIFHILNNKLIKTLLILILKYFQKKIISIGNNNVESNDKQTHYKNKDIKPSEYKNKDKKESEYKGTDMKSSEYKNKRESEYKDKDKRESENKDKDKRESENKDKDKRESEYKRTDMKSSKYKGTNIKSSEYKKNTINDLVHASKLIYKCKCPG